MSGPCACGATHKQDLSGPPPWKTDTANGTKEIRVVDPKTGGAKGRKPEAYALIPAAPLAELARVFGYGAYEKPPVPYGEWNWTKGYSWNLSISAYFRHTEAWRSGQSIDPESGRHHLALANFHLMVLQEFERLGLGTDDRQPATMPGSQPTHEQE